MRPLINRGLTSALQTARLMIIRQLLNLRLLIAEGTGWILPDLKDPEFRFKRVIDQELTDQRFSNL